MNKKLYISICIIFLMIISITYSVKALSIEDLVKERKKELQNQIDTDRIEISNIESEMTDVEKEITKLDEKIATYEYEVNQLNIQALQVEFNMNKAQEQLNEAEENYAEQKKLLEDRILTMYKEGETAFLDVLLSAKTLGEFISKYYYLTEISKFEKKLIDNIEKIKQQIEIRKERLINEQENLNVITASKERTSITLQNARVIRDSYLSQLSEEARERQEQLRAHEKEMEELEQNILKISLSSMNEGYIGGELLWPAPGNSIITSPYGMRIHPLFHVQRMHTGVDIGANKYDPIVAVNSGVVTLAKTSPSYGNYIMVDHGGGIVTLYAHGEELLCKAGDFVEAGQVIMAAGSTGWSTGPHLHFEIRLNGNTVNPLPFISKTNYSGEQETTVEELLQNLINGVNKDKEQENTINANDITINGNKINTNTINSNMIDGNMINNNSTDNNIITPGNTIENLVLDSSN